MAHGDYHCCAICDNKQEYGGLDSSTKEKICPSCLVDLRDAGLSILTVQELKDWIVNTPKDTVIEKMKQVGFRFCYYQNDIDDSIESVGIPYTAGQLLE